MPVIREISRNVGFSEGPVVAPDGAIYVTSIDHACLYRVDAGGTHVFARTGGGPNGATLGSDGSLYVAQNGGRWANDGPRWRSDQVGGVQRVTPDGEVSWLTREPIAPNDLCFGPDGMLYVTDPTREPRLPLRPMDGRIWRVDPSDGTTELLKSVPWFANGIGFGLDGALYVAGSHSQEIWAYDVTDIGLENERLVLTMTEGGPDGFAFDTNGDLVIAAISMAGGPGTIQTWTTAGELRGVFSPGKGSMFTNVAFTNEGDLVITDSTNGLVLLAEGWPNGGLPLHPFRS